MNHLHQNPWSGMHLLKSTFWDFPGGPVVKTLSSNAGSAGSIPGRGAKIPHASRPKNQNLKQKQYCNKFNKDFKNGPHQEKKKKARSSAPPQICRIRTCQEQGPGICMFNHLG